MTDNWLNLSEASAYTRLSARTLRRAIQAGRLRSSQTTGKHLFRKSYLNRFLLFGKIRLKSDERRELEELR